MKQCPPVFVVALLLWTAGPAWEQEPISPPASGRVAMDHGRPTLFIDEAPVYPMLYALTDVPGGRWSWEELPQYDLKLFCDRGIRLFQLDLSLEHLWFEDGRFDVERARNQVANGVYGEWHNWGFYRHEPNVGAHRYNDQEKPNVHTYLSHGSILDVRERLAGSGAGSLLVHPSVRRASV